MTTLLALSFASGCLLTLIGCYVLGKADGRYDASIIVVPDRRKAVK